MGFTRVQHALQLYCPFVDVPELEPLHEDMDAAKDDLCLANSSDRRSRTGRFIASSTFVSNSGSQIVVTFSFVVGRFLFVVTGCFSGVPLFATGAGGGREHS